jgi:hypothetical protein
MEFRSHRDRMSSPQPVLFGAFSGWEQPGTPLVPRVIALIAADVFVFISGDLLATFLRDSAH